jgi:hypothetical protein
MSTSPAGGAHQAETSGVIPSLPGSSDDAGTGPAVRSLFTALVDDAAVFPPGLMPVEQAVPAHVRHAGAWYADLVGPFLVPAAKIEAFAAAAGALPDGATLRAGVVADATASDPLPGAVAALARLAELPGVRPVALELPLPADRDQGEAVADLLPRLLPALPAGVQAWVEIRRGAPGPADGLRRVADAGDEVGAKFRTGGTTAAAFPSTEELAGFIRQAVDVDATFKLTAGLHTAVRGADEPTGAVHHGVLNVIAAVRAALNGAETFDLAAVLGETVPARLASATRRMSDADAAVVRAFFASFGCCGVVDPIEDLVDLGLLEEESA